MLRDMVNRAGQWYAGRVVMTMADFGLAVDIPRPPADSPDAKPIRLHAKSERAKHRLKACPRIA